MAKIFYILFMIYAQPGFADIPAAPFVGEAFDSAPCQGDSVGNGTGPYDYINRVNLSRELNLTEQYHFTPQVERLVKGSTGVLPGDIVFTLTYWPNHHRALNSISLYNSRVKSKGQRLNPPAECWLQRAINFSPKDGTARMLYAIYLQREGHTERAHLQYGVAEELAPTDMSIAYNHALLLVEIEDYTAAVAKAKKVYSAGFPLPGLREKLSRHGYIID